MATLTGKEYSTVLLVAEILHYGIGAVHESKQFTHCNRVTFFKVCYGWRTNKPHRTPPLIPKDKLLPKCHPFVQ